MKKRLKKWGNSFVLVFTPDEAKIYGLVVGDVIEIDDMLLQKTTKIKKVKK
jgi:antitoxin component of MazEF toxin-antitoxin module